MRREGDSSSREMGIFPRASIKEMSIGYALVVVQDALLGLVTPELRAVVVDFDKEKPLLYVRFYYDGEVPQNLLDLWQSSIEKMGVNLGPNCLLDGGIERADCPKMFPFRGRFAYFRKE